MAGLAAIKECKHVGLDPVCYELNSDLGMYRPDSFLTGTMNFFIVAVIVLLVVIAVELVLAVIEDVVEITVIVVEEVIAAVIVVEEVIPIVIVVEEVIAIVIVVVLV